MKLERIKNLLQKALLQEEKSLFELGRKIHLLSELSFEEYKTSQLLIDYLSQNGFQIEPGLAGLKTSFRAYSRVKSKSPAVGFLAEMDALPELGHACGHNLIAISSVGAGVILRKAFPHLAGSIEVFGCPAEERGGGKIIMNRAGVFDHLDLAMLVHPSDRTEIFKLSLALVEVELEFIGRSAHASANPEKGINALECAIQTFNLVSAFGSQLGASARINGIIKEGGTAPNIIPERARVEFWVRDLTLEQALKIAEMVVQAGRSSARALGAKLKAKINRKNAYAPFLPNRTAGKLLWEIFEKLGVKVEQGDEKAELGSTDLGNLSHRVPALHPTIKISSAPPHSPGFAVASGDQNSFAIMKKAILGMAILGYQVLTDGNLRREMKKELKQSRAK